MKRKYQIGGVVYELLNTPQKQLIDLSQIRSQVHEPISLDTPVEIKPYVPSFNIQHQETPIETPQPKQETSIVKPEIKQFKFDVSNPTVSDFHNTLYNAFINAGINPDVAKFIVAQDSLETGDGKHYAGKFNFGNITKGSSWTGSTTRGGDKDSQGRRITQEFRNYNSIDQYVNDKKSLLSSKRYADALNAQTIEEYARLVKAGGYAEDPKYEQKLINKYKSLYG